MTAIAFAVAAARGIIVGESDADPAAAGADEDSILARTVAKLRDISTVIQTVRDARPGSHSSIIAPSIIRQLCFALTNRQSQSIMTSAYSGPEHMQRIVRFAWPRSMSIEQGHAATEAQLVPVAKLLNQFQTFFDASMLFDVDMLQRITDSLSGTARKLPLANLFPVLLKSFDTTFSMRAIIRQQPLTHEIFNAAVAVSSIEAGEVLTRAVAHSKRFCQLRQVYGSGSKTPNSAIIAQVLRERHTVSPSPQTALNFTRLANWTHVELEGSMGLITRPATPRQLAMLQEHYTACGGPGRVVRGELHVNLGRFAQYHAARMMSLSMQEGEAPSDAVAGTSFSVNGIGSPLSESAELVSAVNEVMLFHCVGSESALKGILHSNFDPRLGSGIFGHGAYFADDPCKSLAYSKVMDGNLRHMFVARVIIGRQPQVVRRYSREYSSYEHPALLASGEGFPHSSVVYVGGTKREFIVYQTSLAYPEWSIWIQK